MTNRLLACFALLAFASIHSIAQSLDDLNLQIHGYATQGFLYSSHNKVFSADSNQGSPSWTEAVVNLGVQPASNLSIGVQARYQLLGSKGNSISLDWAAADFRFNDQNGVRIGKVKTPWGLFNETQDIDPSYLWALLPQSIYDITTRDSDLSHFGAVAYGSRDLGASRGKLIYRLWAGEQVISAADGQFDDLNNAAHGPTGALTYVISGAALHWRTPLKGLLVGLSDSKANQASVALTGGSESFSPWNNLSYFTRYDRKRLMLAAEWNRQASASSLQLGSLPASRLNSDARGWYGMATCKLTEKLSAGIYHSQFFDHQAPLSGDRFTKDWDLSGRLDFNQYIYLKAEQHFILGTALSINPTDNPTPRSDYLLSAIKIGFSF